jgi:hypothetical protein
MKNNDTENEIFRNSLKSVKFVEYEVSKIRKLVHFRDSDWFLSLDKIHLSLQFGPTYLCESSNQSTSYQTSASCVQLLHFPGSLRLKLHLYTIATDARTTIIVSHLKEQCGL